MAADRAFSRNYRFRKPRRLRCLLYTIFVGFCVDKFQRVAGRNVLVEPFIFSVIKKYRKAFSRRKPKMISAVCTNLERVLKLALVKRIVTLRAFYKNALGA